MRNDVTPIRGVPTPPEGYYGREDTTQPVAVERQGQRRRRETIRISGLTWHQLAIVVSLLAAVITGVWVLRGSLSALESQSAAMQVELHAEQSKRDDQWSGVQDELRGIRHEMHALAKEVRREKP